MTGGAIYLAQVMNSLDRWKDLGNVDVPNGTRLIGHVPHVAPMAYLHVIFAGLGGEQLEDLKKSAGRDLRDSLIEFYKVWNGCILFSGVLSINGLRTSYDRSIADADRQPFSIRTGNVPERPKNSDHDWVYFGGYNWDGSRLLMDETGKVVLTSRLDANDRKFRWDNLEDMLTSEVIRIADMFDSHGRRRNPGESTLPPLAHTAGRG